MKNEIQKYLGNSKNGELLVEDVLNWVYNKDNQPLLKRLIRKYKNDKSSLYAHLAELV